MEDAIRSAKHLLLIAIGKKESVYVRGPVLNTVLHVMLLVFRNV
jgi:hypothetical protein